MYQETLTVTQDPEIVEKAINFGAIGLNIVIMTLTCMVALTVYALKSHNTAISTLDWIRTNKFRWVLGFLVIVALSVLMVLTPDVNVLLSAIGFNPDKSPIGLGIALTVLLIGATSEPTKVPKGEI